MARGAADLTSFEERARIARELEERSLLSGVLTRTRKRDVIQNRVIREPAIVSSSMPGATGPLASLRPRRLRRVASATVTPSTSRESRRLFAAVFKMFPAVRSNPPTPAKTVGVLVGAERLANRKNCYTFPGQKRRRHQLQGVNGTDP